MTTNTGGSVMVSMNSTWGIYYSSNKCIMSIYDNTLSGSYQYDDNAKVH